MWKSGLLLVVAVVLAAVLTMQFLIGSSSEQTETGSVQNTSPPAQGLGATTVAPQPGRKLEEELASDPTENTEPPGPTYPDPPEYWSRRIDRVVKGLTIVSVDAEEALELLGEILIRAEVVPVSSDAPTQEATVRREIDVPAPTSGIMRGHIELQQGRDGLRSSATLAVPAPLRLMPGAQDVAQSATLQFRVGQTDNGGYFAILSLAPLRLGERDQEAGERAVQEYLASGTCGQSLQFLGIGAFTEWRFFPYAPESVRRSKGGVGERFIHQGTLAAPVNSRWFHERVTYLLGVD